MITKLSLNALPTFFLITLIFIYSFIKILAIFYGLFDTRYSLYILFLILLTSIAIVLNKIVRGSIRISKNDLSIFILITTLSLSVFSQLTLTNNLLDGNGLSTHTFLITQTAFSLIWLLAGYSLQYFHCIQHKTLLPLIILFIITAIIYQASNGGITLNYWEITNYFKNNNNVKVTHLTTGFEFYILLIAIYSYLPSNYRVLVIPVCIYILFLLGGRTNLFLFIFSVLLYQIFKGVLKARSLLFVLFSLLLIITSPFILKYFTLDQNTLSRMTFDEGLDNDGSFQSRVWLFQQTLETLPSQFFFGNVNQLVIKKFYLGAYSHNILSAWEVYGFFAFFVIVMLLMVNFRRVRIINKYFDDPLSTFISLMFYSALVGVIISKNVHFQVLWLSLGLLGGNYFNSITNRVKN